MVVTFMLILMPQRYVSLGMLINKTFWLERIAAVDV